jgi:2-oxoglutarate dehydrogenase complex dehydrogenase (E1) component-like enzyme
LIVAAPKTCFGINERAVSTLDEMGPGTGFKYVIDETNSAIAENSENVYCTGQIYNNLLTERAHSGVTDVAIVHLKQISPFAFDCVATNAATLDGSVADRLIAADFGIVANSCGMKSACV